MITVNCPDCGVKHGVDRVTEEDLGRHVKCIDCLDHDHVRFMRSKAVKLGLTCTPGCECGFGG